MQETQMPSVFTETNALLLIGCIVICAVSPARWATAKKMVIGFFATAAITLIIGWFLFAVAELSLFVAVVIGLLHIKSLKKAGKPLSKLTK
jgi:hypothetical protein